jgi:thiamine biosynthesis lipoprotein
MKSHKNSYMRALAVAAVIFMLAAGVVLLRGQQTNFARVGKNGSGKADAPKPVSIDQIKPGWWESSRLIYFNIPARILLYLPQTDKSEAIELARAAWDEFDRIGAIFNPSDPDSEISRLNAADKNKPVPLSEDLYSVFKISKLLWNKSSGAFDPTIAPLKKLWQNASKEQKIPSARQIKRVISRTGFENIRLNASDHSVTYDNPDIIFDFGGIAKGFAVDMVCRLLLEKGAHIGLVQLGGEVSAFGLQPENRPWKIGIQHPKNMDEIWDVLESHGDIKVSTSGNYRQPIVIQGHEFYHIISPKTGRPVSEKMLGVTTAAFGSEASAALLDGAATAITVLGVDQGLNFAKKLNIEALILDMGTNNKIRQHLTENFSARMNQSSTGMSSSPALPDL